MISAVMVAPVAPALVTNSSSRLLVSGLVNSGSIRLTSARDVRLRLRGDRDDDVQRLRGRGRIAAQQMPAGPGLDDDHRHAMRHHIVQLPGDLGALQPHRLCRVAITFRAQLGRPDPQILGHLAARPEHPADQPPAHRDQQVDWRRTPSAHR